MLSLYIVDIDYEFIEYTKEAFQEHKEVNFNIGPFQQLPPFDCLIWPGNIHTLCTSGMDNTVVDFYGENIHKKLQSYVQLLYRGKQPPGTGIVLHTGIDEYPYVAYTPTFPRREETAYKGMIGALNAIREFNKNEAQQYPPEKTKGPWFRPINTVVSPGLGNYLGMLKEDVKETALQMEQAYRDWKNSV